MSDHAQAGMTLLEVAVALAITAGLAMVAASAIPTTRPSSNSERGDPVEAVLDARLDAIMGGKPVLVDLGRPNTVDGLGSDQSRNHNPTIIAFPDGTISIDGQLGSPFDATTFPLLGSGG